MHVFSHRRIPYRYEVSDRADWIAQYFFTGGIMPSHNLPRQFSDLFAVEQDWLWDGTALRAHRARLAREFRCAARRDHAGACARSMAPMRALWPRRWRIFFLATAGMFGHAGGSEWGVSHYRMRGGVNFDVDESFCARTR